MCICAHVVSERGEYFRCGVFLEETVIVTVNDLALCNIMVWCCGCVYIDRNVGVSVLPNMVTPNGVLS